jgi:hypothetical protein
MKRLFCHSLEGIDEGFLDLAALKAFGVIYGNGAPAVAGFYAA